MINSCMVMPDNTDDTNSVVISSTKDSIKSSFIWNKLVNTIKNFNMDMEKLIKDSIEYGLNVGIFDQGKGGKVVQLEISNDVSISNNDEISTPTKQKAVKHSQSSNLKLRQLSQSECGSITCSSMSFPNTIQTRQSANKNDLKRSLKLIPKVGKIKRQKSGFLTTITHDMKSVKNINDRRYKCSAMKPIKRDMARAVPICAYCLGDELINKRTKLQEDMIVCWDCGTCAHPRCLQWPKSLLEKVRTLRWQCLQCKCCSYCGSVSKKDDEMLLCDACDQGFHMYCFNPPIKTPPKGEWICRLCRPRSHHRDIDTFFSMDDFNFFPNCQIVTSENVLSLCMPRKKLPNSFAKKKSKVGKFLFKSDSKVDKRPLKLSLLHMKKKKLLEKAVKRQKLALTDGLSMFFTPGNKRQSRVSKQSLSFNNLNDLSDRKSSVSSTKERSSLRCIISRTRSKSPISFEKELSHKHKDGFVKPCKEEKSTIIDSIDSKSVYITSPTIVSNSNESVATDNGRCIKKPLRRSNKRVTIEQKIDSLTEASVIESSNATMSRIDESSSQSIMFTDNTETDPYPISDMDKQWYSEIQNQVAELLPPAVDAPPQLHSLNKTSRHRTEHSEPPELSMEGTNTKDSLVDCRDPSGDNIFNPNQRFPPRIQIGKYVIDTWYSAPYPSEYARLNILYICEYCLKHIKSYDIYVMHTEKCIQHFPPGNEIYRNGELSIFEVDGYVSKLYCQQLCLLAKLFLDHKTLYYDVEPFLFYVAVISKNQSCHIIGYFSKEKRSTHKYNLSCIMVLPPYQKFNYGRFLIDFSYLLSLNEGQNGSPEKPLSTLGRLSYESYWKSKVIPYLLNRDNVTGEFYRHARFSKPPKGLSITIDKISVATGINPHDVASTIQMLSKTVDLDESDQITIQLDWSKIKSESEKYSKKYSSWIPLKADCLRWIPLIQSNDKVQSHVKESENLSNQITHLSLSQSSKEDTKISKTVESSNRKSSRESKSDMGSNNPQIKNDKSQQKSHKLVDTSKRTSSLSLNRKCPPKYKRECTERTIVTRNQFPRQYSSDEPQIVTRNRSNSKHRTMSANNNCTDPIKVDLTNSDQSDNQENDDCVFVASGIMTRKPEWRKNQTNLEMFKDTLVSVSDNETIKSKSSPPVTTNEPSPVSTGQNEIIRCALVSPEIDLEEETETDLILSGGRRPLIILEKCDNRSHLLVEDISVIDLSDDSINENGNVAYKVDDQFDREMNVSCTTSKSNTPKHDSNNLSLESDNANSDNIADFSLANIEFILPACIKEPNNLEDIAPTLSRVSSDDSNSAHQDDSSNSLQLLSNISLNEEFKRFYNDGNVFNSITTSQTDSSDKDTDESLLSVSNSDLEMNGAYSCDSSICFHNKTTAILIKPDDDQLDDHIVCSPCQSDLVQSQVSSTTPFIAPSIVWNASSKSMPSSMNFFEADLTKIAVTIPRYHHSKSSDGISVSEVGYEDIFGKDGESDMPIVVEDTIDKDIVSSSLGNLGDSCVEDELVVSSMALPLLSAKMP